MRVQFWGTRGSIAKPGPSTARYGGNTSCIEVRSARGTLVIVDCGTGGHPLGQNLMSAGAEGLRGHILISHTHWDHIQGIPFFAPLFVPGNEWDIYGPKGLGQSLRETLAGQMQYTYFPVTLDQCGAKIRYHDLVEGTFDIDDIKVSTHYLNHPALTLGYRLEADGVTVVYCCDHEPHSRMLATGHGDITGQDLRYAKFFNRADLLIHDAQYTAEEYPAKVGWGHSSVEYVVNLGRYAEVKRIALTHHDPLRDDDAIDRLVANVRAGLRENASSLDVFAAVEGQIVEVAASRTKRPAHRAGEFQAEMPIEPALAEWSVLLGIGDTKMAAALSEAIRAEGIHAKFFSDIDEARTLIAKDRPSLAILEHGKYRQRRAVFRNERSRLIKVREKFGLNALGSNGLGKGCCHLGVADTEKHGPLGHRRLDGHFGLKLSSGWAGRFVGDAATSTICPSTAAKTSNEDAFSRNPARTFATRRSMASSSRSGS